ncbi:MAG: TldD/PmbA family protein [Syntrophomonadaceae bacterium]|jgi:PmbA protein
MIDRLTKAGEKALAWAGQAGLEAEAFLLHTRELSIEIVNQQVDSLKQAEEIGLGLRVINQHRLGFAYSTELSDQAIKKVVEDAIGISNYTTLDEFHAFPKGAFTLPQLHIYDDAIPQTSLDHKISLARKLEQIAKKKDQRVTVVEKAGYEDTEFTCLVMNSSGVKCAAIGNFCGIFLFLVAEERGDAQNGFGMMLKRRIKEMDPGLVGQETVENAVRMLNAKTISSTKTCCLLEPYVASKFLALISQMVNADAVLKGKSLLAQRQGDRIAGSSVNLVDNGLYEEGAGCFPFDDEGYPAQNKTIIENGILMGFLHDTYTAKRCGVESTGNSQRASFRSMPSIGTTNFYLQPGKRTQAEMIAEIDRGLLVTEVLGMHTANPISGDFSLGAAGIMIEKGRLSYPVRGLTIAGNLITLLKDIEEVGSDLRFFGSRGSPTILIKNVSIGGD